MKEIEIFKAAGEETRLRILRLLVFADAELCTCEIIDALEKPQYTVSKSLGILVSNGLVKERREGKQMMYACVHSPFNDSIFEAVKCIPCSQEGCAGDISRLKARLAKRKKGVCTEGCI